MIFKIIRKQEEGKSYDNEKLILRFQKKLLGQQFKQVT